MEKDFDFKDIGKRMPYRTPEGFFERMQDRVEEQAGIRKSGRRKPVLRLVAAAVLGVAAMGLGVMFFPVSGPDTERLPSTSLLVSAEDPYSEVLDRYVESLTDDELAEWVELSDNDIFMNVD